MTIDDDIAVLYRAYDEIRGRSGCQGCETYRMSLLNSAKALHRIGTRHALIVEDELRTWLAQASSAPPTCADPFACMPVDPYARFLRALQASRR